MTSRDSGNHPSSKNSDVLTRQSDGSFELVVDQESPEIREDGPENANPEAAKTGNGRTKIRLAVAASIFIAIGFVGYWFTADETSSDSAASLNLEKEPGFKPWSSRNSKARSTNERPERRLKKRKTTAPKTPVVDEEEPTEVAEPAPVRRKRRNDSGKDRLGGEINVITPDNNPLGLELPVTTKEEVVSDTGARFRSLKAPSHRMIRDDLRKIELDFAERSGRPIQEIREGKYTPEMFQKIKKRGLHKITEEDYREVIEAEETADESEPEADSDEESDEVEGGSSDDESEEYDGE